MDSAAKITLQIQKNETKSQETEINDEVRGKCKLEGRKGEDKKSRGARERRKEKLREDREKERRGWVQTSVTQRDLRPLTALSPSS